MRVIQVNTVWIDIEQVETGRRLSYAKDRSEKEMD